MTLNLADAPGTPVSETLKRERDVYHLLAEDAIKAFRALPGDWLAGLTEAQVRHVTEQVLCLIPARRWRIHKDYPVCVVCREPVERRAAEERERAENEGRVRAGRIHEKFLASLPPIKEND